MEPDKSGGLAAAERPDPVTPAGGVKEPPVIVSVAVMEVFGSAVFADFGRPDYVKGVIAL